MEATMATVNTKTQYPYKPPPRLGFLGRLMRQFWNACMDSAMYRIAPTRKM
jgi:hypothetical protein